MRDKFITHRQEGSSPDAGKDAVARSFRNLHGTNPTRPLRKVRLRRFHLWKQRVALRRHIEGYFGDEDGRIGLAEGGMTV